MSQILIKEFLIPVNDGAFAEFHIECAYTLNVICNHPYFVNHFGKARITFRPDQFEAVDWRDVPATGKLMYIAFKKLSEIIALEYAA